MLTKGAPTGRAFRGPTVRLRPTQDRPAGRRRGAASRHHDGKARAGQLDRPGGRRRAIRHVPYPGSRGAQDARGGGVHHLCSAQRLPGGTKLYSDDLVEVFTLRAILEEALIRDAMPAVTADVVDEMRSANAEMDESLEAGDLIAVGVSNRQFHFLTFQQSRMARTKRIVTQLWNTADAYRPLYSPLLDMVKVCDEHTLMIDAMAERDVDAMVVLNHEHRSHALDPIHRDLLDGVGRRRERRRPPRRTGLAPPGLLRRRRARTRRVAGAAISSGSPVRRRVATGVLRCAVWSERTSPSTTRGHRLRRLR